MQSVSRWALDARSLAWARPAALAFVLLARPSLASGEDPPSPAMAPPAPSEPRPRPAPPPATPAPAPAPPPGGIVGGPPPDSPPMPTGPAERTAWRETTWRAPSAADWEKPVLLTFQRTWDDAVAVAKETGRPILVCINMDGEIASEHYAGVRYREPEIAALYEPYVAVIASVYRHNPRDHDDEGRRILCPRFGSVTCAEHIAIEPVIFEKFCDGRRIAPRHICVELDGNESYDVFYANDTASIFRTIREGISKRPPLPARVVRGDRPAIERVGSREVTDRTAVEEAYRTGDEAARRALLAAAAKHPDASPLDLLRLAVFGFDPDASRAARAALAKTADPAATDLLASALRVPMSKEEREALVATLSRLGGASPLARWLAVVHRGLGTTSGSVDVSKAAGSTAGGASYAPVERPDWDALEARLASGEEESRTRPTDANALLELAETSLAMAGEAPGVFAADLRRSRVWTRFFYAEAKRAALEAEKLGAAGWRVNAVLTLALYHSGDAADAYARAVAAVKEIPAGDSTFESMSVLTIFAEGRFRQIKKSVKEKTDFPPEWLADVHAAYALLRKHPHGNEGQVIWHYDLLDWLGASDQATQVLREGLERFRDSPVLHERLRNYVLMKRGPRGLEAYYEEMTKAKDASPALASFSGSASVASAEALRRRRLFDRAADAYGRAIAHFERAAVADPKAKPAADAAIALALAARARVAFQAGNDEKALDDVLASFARSPGTAGTRDGMGITPGETAQVLLARLKETKKDAAAARLEAALGTLDPELLRPDRE